MPPLPVPSTPSLFSAIPGEPGSDPAGRAGRGGDVAAKSGWLQAHCDGGARGNPGPAGYGAVLEDESGAVIAELSEFLGLRTNNYAEYSGLLGCLQYALDRGYGRLKVISDSELMVKQIQGKYQVKSPDLKPLYEEAKRRIARLDGFAISHALRHKNKAADRLANEAMDRGMKRPEAAVTSRAATPARAAPYGTGAETPQTGKVEAAPIPISMGGRAVVRERAVPVLTAAGSEAKESEAKVPEVNGPVNKAEAMLRGFTRNGVVHILGGVVLPDGVFVKIIRE